VIIDRLDRLDKDYEPESDGFIRLRKLTQRQTVLIARTGAEEGLSVPISFESLKSQSLPLKRSDVITQDVDVVRVSLAAAVQFIVSLEVREGLAILKTKALDTSLYPYPPSKGFEENDRVCYSPKAWADALMVVAERHGYNNIPETRESVRRVQAGLMEKDSASSNLCHLETGGTKVMAKLEVLAYRASSLISLLKQRMSLFAFH